MRVVTSPGPETPACPRRVRHHRQALPWLAALALVTGCGSTGGPAPATLQGASSGVAWEIVDIGQLASADNQRMRWSYVIVLRETSGSAVLFERVERSVRTTIEMVGGSPESYPFARTLAVHGELRYATSDSWGWTRESGRGFGGAATIPTLTVEHRFIGRTSGGQPVAVTARIHLDRSVGKIVTPTPSTSGPLPPRRVLKDSSDLATLAGRWRGSVRTDGREFDVPVEFTLEPDGTLRVALNDPVTERFRAAMSVRDGGLAYAGTNGVSGPFALHEQDGRRILAGYVTNPRQGSEVPVGHTIRVQWQGP